MSNEVKNLLHVFEEWIQFAQSLLNKPMYVWNSSIEPGKWTVKDIVCHIMLWDKYFYDEAIHKIATFRTSEGTAERDATAWSGPLLGLQMTS